MTLSSERSIGLSYFYLLLMLSVSLYFMYTLPAAAVSTPWAMLGLLLFEHGTRQRTTATNVRDAE